MTRDKVAELLDRKLAEMAEKGPARPIFIHDADCPAMGAVKCNCRPLIYNCQGWARA